MGGLVDASGNADTIAVLAMGVPLAAKPAYPCSEDCVLSKPATPPSARPLSNAMQEAAAREHESGQMLLELERRQDDVLSQLDDLDQKLTSILRGLGVTMSADEDADQPSGIRLADLGEDSDEDEVLSSRDEGEVDEEAHGGKPTMTLFAADAAQRRRVA